MKDDIEVELAALREENEALSTLLKKEIDRVNIPCADALDKIWAEVILKDKPEYGDWQYPMQAARHIIAEVEELRTAIRYLKIDHKYLVRAIRKGGVERKKEVDL